MTDHAERIARIEHDLIPGNLHGERGRASIAEQMARRSVPGLSVAVFDGGGRAWARGYGLRHAVAGGAVGVATLFQAASISKPTTALGVLRLVERGQLALDRDVNDYLTSWRVPARAGWQPRLTLRQLLSHTAGLTVHGFPGYGAGATLPALPQILDGAAPANTAAVRVDTLPGVHFRYSGGGTTIVQQLIEDVTGELFSDFMQREVLEPLGMTQSGYLQPLPTARWSDAATGHHVGGTPVCGGAHVYPERAAAGLWTTAQDLAHMAHAVQALWCGVGDRFLRQETVRGMLTPQGESQIGIGFFLAGADASAQFFHWGGNLGFSCVVLVYRESGQGAAIMTNSDEGSFVVEELLAAIAREYSWPDYPTNTRPSLPPPADLIRFQGSYALPAGPRISVDVHDNGLTLSLGGQPVLNLDPLGERVFQAGALAVEIEFIDEPGSGAVVAMLLRQNGREERARKY